VRLLGAVVTGLMLLLSQAAAAQDFPSKPIKADRAVFRPAAPTTSSPVSSASACRKLTKQPIIIDNRGGQGGRASAPMRSPKANPDGYTIGIVNAGALTINQSMEKVSYETLKDLAPVTLVVTRAGNAGGRRQCTGQQHGRARRAWPGRSPERSTSPPPAPAACRISPANCSSSPRKSTSCTCPIVAPRPAINDLLGQQVQMTFLDLPAILPHIRSGALRPIALGTTARARRPAPDVPTNRRARHARAQDRELVWHDRAGGKRRRPPLRH